MDAGWYWSRQALSYLCIKSQAPIVLSTQISTQWDQAGNSEPMMSTKLQLVVEILDLSFVTQVEQKSITRPHFRTSRHAQVSSYLYCIRYPYDHLGCQKQRFPYYPQHDPIPHPPSRQSRTPLDIHWATSFWQGAIVTITEDQGGPFVSASHSTSTGRLCPALHLCLPHRPLLPLPLREQQCFPWRPHSFMDAPSTAQVYPTPLAVVDRSEPHCHSMLTFNIYLVKGAATPFGEWGWAISPPKGILQDPTALLQGLTENPESLDLKPCVYDDGYDSGQVSILWERLVAEPGSLKGNWKRAVSM